MSKKENSLIPDESVVNKIYLIRGHKVMLDMDLAELYGVETKQLKRAVKRNLVRFPEDFMFEMNAEELEDFRCQIGTEIKLRSGSRYTPMAFTEQGVAMLSTHKDILLKLEQLEKKVTKHDDEMQLIFDYLKDLLNPKTEAKPIGFQYK